LHKVAALAPKRLICRGGISWAGSQQGVYVRVRLVDVCVFGAEQLDEGIGKEGIGHVQKSS